MTEKIKKDINTNEVEDVKDPQKEIEDSKAKSDEYLNNWKRERADFINYKNEEMERIGFLGKYVKEDIILKILPILDNIYLAEKQLPENLSIEWTKGFLQIQNQILDFLKKEGIEEIKSIGEKFDPSTMEAIEEVSGVPDSAEAPVVEAGTVVEEVQKGYTMDGKIIRPARVKISK